MDSTALVRFALDHLGGMRSVQDPELFAFEVREDSARPSGLSLRYSLMALLGLGRAEQCGLRTSVDLPRLWFRLKQRADDATLTPGDLGLYLWNASRLQDAGIDPFLRRLAPIVHDPSRLGRLEGMEIAWLLIGFCQCAVVPGSALARSLAHRQLHYLLGHLLAPSGLLYHHGRLDLRMRLPNFATLIYGLLAFVVAARTGIGDRHSLIRQARILADRLLRSRLPDGGWPWIVDAERGDVVEPYEVYAVHQDAMAPMALLALSELTGDPAYAQEARKSLTWTLGQNQLRQNMVLEDRGLIYRSIRRKRPWDRLALLAQSGLAVARSVLLPKSLAVPVVVLRTPLEINRTCRPYHLAWILEAWCRG